MKQFILCSAPRTVDEYCGYLMLLSLLMISQLPAQIMPATIGATFGDRAIDEGNFVISSGSGDYFIAGNMTDMASGERRGVVIKTDSHGAEIWRTTFGNTGYESAEGLALAPDGGLFVLSIHLVDPPNDYDTHLLKLDRNGTVLWTRKFGGDQWDWGNDIRPTPDGGTIICGWSSSGQNGSGDLWVLKLDADGIEQWQQTYGGIEYDGGEHILPLADGGYFVTGTTRSYSIGQEDVWVVRLSGEGALLWMRIFGGKGADQGQFAVAIGDGGYLILGSTTSSGSGESDLWLIRIDANGETLWSQTYGGKNREWGGAIARSADGFTIIGTTFSEGMGQSDMWLFEIDSGGNTLWESTYGGAQFEFGESLHTTVSGGYILTGNTYSFGQGESDIWLIEVDIEGKVQF